MIGWPMGSNNSTVMPQGGAIVLTWLGCCLSWTFEWLGTLHSISSKQSCEDFTTWGVRVADSLIVLTILDMLMESFY